MPKMDTTLVALGKQPPQQLLDVLLALLEAGDGDSGLLVLPTEPSPAEAAEGKGGLWGLGIDIVERGLDGVSTLIKDDYKDNLAARRDIDRESRDYMRKLHKDLYG